MTPESEFERLTIASHWDAESKKFRKRKTQFQIALDASRASKVGTACPDSNRASELGTAGNAHDTSREPKLGAAENQYVLPYLTAKVARRILAAGCAAGALAALAADKVNWERALARAGVEVQRVFPVLSPPPQRPPWRSPTAEACQSLITPEKTLAETSQSISTTGGRQFQSKIVIQSKPMVSGMSQDTKAKEASKVVASLDRATNATNWGSSKVSSAPQYRGEAPIKWVRGTEDAAETSRIQSTERQQSRSRTVTQPKPVVTSRVSQNTRSKTASKMAASLGQATTPGSSKVSSAPVERTEAGQQRACKKPAAETGQSQSTDLPQQPRPANSSSKKSKLGRRKKKDGGRPKNASTQASQSGHESDFEVLRLEDIITFTYNSDGTPTGETIWYQNLSD